MQITCLGAAGMVTGSCYRVDMGGESFLVDCGMFQGGRKNEANNWRYNCYRPRSLKAIYLTHAHIDHSGLVPRMVRQGFRGPVYATKATCQLLEILWLDAAHIQEMEAEWQTRKNKRKGSQTVEPLYEQADAEAAIELLHPVEMDDDNEFVPGVVSRFVNAGHILGASSLHLSLKSNLGERRVGFSGDIGRTGQLIVPDPSPMPPLDMVFMETTYGNRGHKSISESQEELLAVINRAYDQGGKVIIPVFAVERTQDLIFTMAQACRAGRFPQDMPVYVDSPLAIKATEIFRQCAEFFDDETKEILLQGDTPLNFPNLQFSVSTEESRAINRRKGPAVIMAGNGMATAGRIKHHMKHNLWKKNTHMVVVGFQAQGSTGRRLVEGAKTVKIFREDVAVAAKVHTINGFSAHADQDELMVWLAELMQPGLQVNLIHGEESQTAAFAQSAGARFPQARFHLPVMGEILQLITGPPLEIPGSAELAARAQTLSRELAYLAERLAVSEGDLSSQETEDLARKLAAAERLLHRERGA